jgi:hypothetical protein
VCRRWLLLGLVTEADCRWSHTCCWLSKALRLDVRLDVLRLLLWLPVVACCCCLRVVLLLLLLLLLLWWQRLLQSHAAGTAARCCSSLVRWRLPCRASVTIIKQPCTARQGRCRHLPAAAAR